MWSIILKKVKCSNDLSELQDYHFLSDALDKWETQENVHFIAVLNLLMTEKISWIKSKWKTTRTNIEFTFKGEK